MILSGLLMFGSAQRHRIIRFIFLSVLFVYLFMNSLSLTFFSINISVIFLLSFVLKKINCHALSGASILIYSVIIDIVSFYFFPLFPINISLMTYIMSGLMFNFTSALPAIILGISMNIILILRSITVHKKQNLQKTSKQFLID